MMTPEETAQAQADYEIKNELTDAIYNAVREVTMQYDKVSLAALVSALETVKTRYIVDVAVAKAAMNMKEVKDATA